MVFDETFWVAASLGLFLGLFFKPLKNGLLSFLDASSQHVKEELDKASHVRQDAEIILTSSQNELAQAKDNAEAILKNAEAEVARLFTQMEEELKTLIEKKTEVTLERIAAYENKVLQDIRQHALDIAFVAIRSLLREYQNQSVNQDTIDEMIDTLQKRIN